ncbi:MAG: hypothetical protein ABI488_01765 [Polyangiaceae bacterium]
MNVQDAFVTFKPAANLIKVDAGFMLPPLSHNGVQGAATLYGGDYFVNTFRRNISGERARCRARVFLPSRIEAECAVWLASIFRWERPALSTA